MARNDKQAGVKVNEHLKAKRWRERLKLSVIDLSKLTGYSIESIYLFEKGFTYDARGKTKSGDVRTKAINPEAWKRYRMACAGVGQTFRW